MSEFNVNVLRAIVDLSRLDEIQLSIRSGVGLGNVMSSELNKDQISLTAVDAAMN